MKLKFLALASLTLLCCSVAAIASAAEEAPPVGEVVAPEGEASLPETEAPPAGEEEASALLDESCSGGNVCSWTFVHFWEVKNNSLCTGGPHPLAGLKYSAKNRCANKKAFLKLQGTTHQVCMNPNGDRTTTEFDEVYIGAEGSRC